MTSVLRRVVAPPGDTLCQIGAQAGSRFAFAIAADACEPVAHDLLQLCHDFFNVKRYSTHERRDAVDLPVLLIAVRRS